MGQNARCMVGIGQVLDGLSYRPRIFGLVSKWTDARAAWLVRVELEHWTARQYEIAMTGVATGRGQGENPRSREA